MEDPKYVMNWEGCKESVRIPAFVLRVLTAAFLAETGA
jgi:hypothetical protein